MGDKSMGGDYQLKPSHLLLIRKYCKENGINFDTRIINCRDGKDRSGRAAAFYDVLDKIDENLIKIDDLSFYHFLKAAREVESKTYELCAIVGMLSQDWLLGFDDANPTTIEFGHLELESKREFVLSQIKKIKIKKFRECYNSFF